LTDDRVLLTTERLELRAFRESDFDLLVDLDGDPEVMRYLTGGTGTSPDIIRAKVLPRFMAYDSEQPAFGYWAAILSETREFIGWFAFHPREDRPEDEIEIGYRLRRSMWGRGLATEGAQALVRRDGRLLLPSTSRQHERRYRRRRSR
jgi:RimJ/RimL family protein N-acetyltransferase